jgi:hypothetical protein
MLLREEETKEGAKPLAGLSKVCVDLRLTPNRTKNHPQAIISHYEN